MPYEFQILKCPRGCPDTFWILTEMYAHHFAHHERPLPSMDHMVRAIIPPPGGVPPTWLELAKAARVAEAATDGREGRRAWDPFAGRSV